MEAFQEFETERRSASKAAQQAVAADEGLSTLDRWSTSRGRAAFEMNECRRATPAVLLSTIAYGLRR
jgi:hypothetical protein